MKRAAVRALVTKIPERSLKTMRTQGRSLTTMRTQGRSLTKMRVLKEPWS